MKTAPVRISLINSNRNNRSDTQVGIEPAMEISPGTFARPQVSKALSLTKIPMKGQNDNNLG